MRCGRARSLIAAAVDGEVVARRRRAFDRHLADCAGCRRELEETRRVLALVADLPDHADVPPALEQETLRRVRRLAAEERERSGTRARPWWAVLGVPAVAIATTAVVMLAVGVWRTGSAPDGIGAAPSRTAANSHAAAPSRAVARRETPTRLAKVAPAEPPPELAADPDLFVDLPILRNMDKLQHFDAIRTTTLDDDQSNG